MARGVKLEEFSWPGRSRRCALRVCTRVGAAAITIHSSVAATIFWIAVACCAAAQIAIVCAVIRAAQRQREPGAESALPGRAAEIAWALIPAAMLALVLVLTWHAVREAHVPAASARIISVR